MIFFPSLISFFKEALICEELSYPLLYAIRLFFPSSDSLPILGSRPQDMPKILLFIDYIFLIISD